MFRFRKPCLLDHAGKAHPVSSRLCLLPALLLVLLARAPLRADLTDQFFYQGYEAQYNGDYDRAIPNWNEVLNLNPNNLAARKNRGLAYLYKDDWLRSIDDYNQVIRRRPNDLTAFTGRAYAHFQRRDWDEAIDDYKTAIGLNPKNWVLYRNLGRVYLTLGNWDDAITNFTKSIRLNPRDSWTYNCRAVAQEDKGDLEAAIADFEKALQLSPDYANVYVNCGQLLQYRKHNLGIAIIDYTEAIRLDPANANTFITRADAYVEQKDYVKAVSDYNTAVQLQPTNAECYFSRGNFQHQMTNYDAAIRDYNEAIRLDPTNSWYLVWRGDFYEQMTNYDAASLDYNEVVRLYPTNAWCLKWRGEFYEEMTNYDAAIRDFTRCIELEPTNADHYATRADAEELVAKSITKPGDQNQKQAALDRAQLDWDHAAAWDPHRLMDLGWFDRRNGQYEAAIADYTEYIRTYPSNYMGRINRAYTCERAAMDYAKRGDLEKKNTALQQALADWYQLVISETNRECDWLCERGDFYARNNQYANALADYRQAVELFPTNCHSLISLAWFLATCPDKAFRSGSQAVSAAQKACDLLPEKHGFYLAGLAAAEAEARDYGQAVQFQKQALEMKEFSDVSRLDMLHRLALYERKSPCHKILGFAE